MLIKYYDNYHNIPNMITYLKKFLYNESGVITLEYALGLATLGMVIVLGVTDVGTTVRIYMRCVSIGENRISYHTLPDGRIDMRDRGCAR